MDGGETRAPVGEVGAASFDYLPVLDGFRAISILLVVISHAGLEWLVPGGLGVVVFFVISGFLITRQMIAEIAATGTLSFKAFYLRRVFRLAPALLLYLAVFDTLLGALGADITPMHVISGVFYFANYYHIFIGYPPHNPNPILWSLAIEEHFYLVAPMAVFLCRRNLKGLLAGLCLAAILAPLWRLALYLHCSADPSGGICGIPGGLRIFHGTDTMFDCIAYGCLMAVVLHLHGHRVGAYLRSGIPILIAAAVLLSTLLLRNPVFRDTLRYSLQAGSIAVVLASMLYGCWPWLGRLLCTRPSLFVGRLSYSLYLFHFGVGTVLVLLFPGHSLLEPGLLPVFLAASFSFAALSYYAVERPMVAVRKRFSAARFKRADAPAPSGKDSLAVGTPLPR